MGYIWGDSVDATMKSTLVGLYLVLLSAFSGGLGIAIFLATPFGAGSALVGVAFVLASIVSWGWACFARKELFQ